MRHEETSQRVVPIALPGAVDAALIRGSLWMAISAALGRSASFLAQIILGWYLSQEDFALYAIAISSATILSALKSGGSLQLLIQKGSEYQRVAQPLFKFALVFNVATMLLLGVTALVVARVYQQAELIGLFLVIAISLPLSTPAMVFRAKLAIDKRFGSLAKLGLISNVARQAAMAILAVLGFGPMSFVLPLLLVAVVETIVGWSYVKSWPPAGRLDKDRFSRFLRDSKWVMVGALAMGLSLQGDFLVIGFFEEAKDLGVYFFGYQLIFTLAVLFTSSLEAVLPPTFARLTNDDERLRQEFLRAVKGMMIIALPAGISLAFLSPALINLIWSGKWDSSIAVVQILSLGLPFWLLVNVTGSLLHAQGKWRARTMLLALYGLGGMVAVGVGAWAGSVAAIAAAACLYRTVFALSQAFFVAQMARISTRELARCTFLPAILAIGATMLGIAASLGPLQSLFAYSSHVGGFLVFAATYLTLVSLGYRNETKALLHAIAK